MALVIDQFASTRAFANAVPSGSTPIFLAGQDRGQLKFRGARETPVCAYVLFARDPVLAGQYPWDLSWSETVFWLPSPFVAPKEGDVLILMSRPEHVQAKPGRFTATAVLVWDQSVLSRLDPRGEATSPIAFDEEQTCQFINEVHTLAAGRTRRDMPAISVSTAEYEVRVP
ncbi:MAG: hypothetical protein JSS22_08805, partial [Proteobacteria bacterium]|nr:hypothetical protein [Pseudomonadota bacterium]